MKRITSSILTVLMACLMVSGCSGREDASANAIAAVQSLEDLCPGQTEAA